MTTSDVVNMWIGAFKAYCSSALKTMGEIQKNEANAGSLQYLYEQLNAAISWLIQNEYGEADAIKNRLTELRILCNPILTPWRDIEPVEESFFDWSPADMWLGILKSQCSYKLRDIRFATNDEEKSLISAACNEGVKWMIENPSADAEAIKKRLEALTNEFDSITAKLTSEPVAGSSRGVVTPNVPGASDTSDDDPDEKEKNMPAGAPPSGGSDDSDCEPAAKKQKC